MKALKVILVIIIFINYTRGSSAQSKYASNAVNVAVLVYDGVETLDFTGPAETFSDASNDNGLLCHVYIVAATDAEITSQGFLKVKPNYSIANCPKPDIIVIPGGSSGAISQNKEVLNWITVNNKAGAICLSVCTGAFVLASTGLLDGKTATTHFCCQDNLAKQFPNVNVVKNERFVDNGSTITTEGISAGIDGSLYLIEKRFGHAVALDAANYMMYDWRPDELRKVINN